jgi:hypothetical protein
MRTLLLALLLSVPFASLAQAETAARGFNPRFSTSPAFANEPNYRRDYVPPSWLDTNAEDGDWWDRERRGPCRDGRSCRGNRPRN